jgi:predicted transposase/invertase (TIGR01784 family)
MIVGIDPKVDYVFKRIFGREQNEPVLVHLLNAVLERPPREQVVSVQLMNPFQDKDFEDAKLSILDIKARDQLGRQFNVEMQMLARDVFRHRVLYYWAKLHGGQLEEGMDYDQLQPTVSICFVNTILFPELAGWHGRFQLREQQAGVVFSDQLELHLFELPKFTRTAADVQTPLERWLYFLIHGEGLDPEHLPAALQVPEIQRALGEMQYMTQSEIERHRYESRLKALRDENMNVRAARREGHIKVIRLCQHQLRQPLTPVEELRALPLADLERIAQELEAEAWAK